MSSRQRDINVALCVGKDCRRHDDYPALQHALRDADVTVASVACLDCCHSPVVVVRPASKSPLVIEKIRKPKHRRALIELLAQGTAPRGGLEKRVVRGKHRKKALRRLRKQRRRVAAR